MIKFGPRAKTEREYRKQLQLIAKEIGKIVKQYYDPANPTNVVPLEMALTDYAAKIEPWARKAAKEMMKQVNFFNVQDFRVLSERLGQNFKQNYTSGADAVFRLASDLYVQQIELIRSLPLEAAKRVQELARKASVEGLRHTELIERIQESGPISWRRARTIARTEVAKVNSTLVQARSESLGITKFIWRTAGDENVRSAHSALNGRIFEFKNPPYVAGEGNVLPGQVFNCRCIAEPLIEPAMQMER